MLVFTQILPLRQHLKALRRQGKTTGLVPTMGALHEGHIALIRQSKQATDLTVCSIFVNPTQFNNPADLAKYPRTVEADSQLLSEAGCDILFLPETPEMYPQPAEIRFSFGSLETVMEGKFRPGHFAGVGLVVSKLFHIVEPDQAFFGQKDLQQCAVISKMVSDLNFDLELIICSTVREPDGLAMSSRNRRLTPENRRKAPILFQKLQEAASLLGQGNNPEGVQQKITAYFSSRPDLTLEYFEIVNALTLQPVLQAGNSEKTALCIAAFFGEVRLIDNLILA